VARAGTSASRELPPPLPPETRTVGQLIAEAIRLYGRRFWAALPLGIPLAVADEISFRHGVVVRILALWAVSPLVTAAFVAACALAADARPQRRAVLRAYGVGLLVFAPFPLLAGIFLLPGLAWLAFFGLAVPAALLERRDLRGSLRRGLELARADYVHALGGLASLALVYGVSATALVQLLRAQGDQAARIALFLSDVVLSPLVFLGAALLYYDQKARLSHGDGGGRMRNDGDLPRRESRASGTVRHPPAGGADRRTTRRRHDR
jgi:hypothetical protein